MGFTAAARPDRRLPVTVLSGSLGETADTNDNRTLAALLVEELEGLESTA